MDQYVVDAARTFAVSHLSSSLHPQIKFHDLEHTKTVVSASHEIALEEGVSENDLQLLEVAAWFHDLGYPKQVEGHEKIGAEMARDFLLQYPVSKTEIACVERIILSTEMIRKPNSFLEKIIRDADMAHLGMENAADRSRLLREEREAMLNLSYSDAEWLKTNIDFYEGHAYNTETAKRLFGSMKDQHLRSMKKVFMEISDNQ